MSIFAERERLREDQAPVSRAAENLWQGIDRVYRRLTRAENGESLPVEYSDGEDENPESEDTESGDGALTALRRSVYEGSELADWRPIARLREVFGLSEFEGDILLLCAGAALDGRFTSALAVEPADLGKMGGASSTPTFGVAAARLENPHWSAISRVRPLRYWRLVEVGPGPLTQAALTIDERILQFLLAVPAVDERLDAMHPLNAMGDGADVIDGAGNGLEEDQSSENGESSEFRQAVRLGMQHWSEEPRVRGPILLCGGRSEERTSLFSALCREANLRGWVMDAADLPSAAAERERLARAFTREAALSRVALLVRTVNLENPRDLEAWLARVDAPVAVEAAPGSPAERLNGLRMEVAGMTAGQRKALWLRELGPLANRLNNEDDFSLDATINATIDAMVDAFALDAREIRQTASQLRKQERLKQDDLGQRDQAGFRSEAWRLCRRAAQRSLDELATRIEVRAGWNDLVLPEAQVSILRQILANARQSAKVYQDWGFAGRYERGLGLSTLFSGASGTGKTMAAAILAREMDRDLYQIDLATVVSKYIGETEKHLRRIFDAAERSGAILLFDEADALFGKRSPIKDSHDRYANLEVSYLLQRMESYRGIALLTTNMQSALDTAFQRRLRFVVQFPFPDAAGRERIWRSVFPAAAPTAALDYARLAQLNVTGGVIRNIALMAAFVAADENSEISMRHVMAAARTEYAKLDKPLSAAEIRGWEDQGVAIRPAPVKSGGRA